MSLATAWGLPTTFYDGSPGRETVPCRDCECPADALFGDHGGVCVGWRPVARPTSALGIIRRAALANGRLDANMLRAAFDQAGVPGPSRGPAFAAAERRGWLERDGYTPSTDAATRGHPVARYTSLIAERKSAS